MIIEFLLAPIFAIVSKGFELIRMDRVKIPGWLGDTLDLVADAMMFFPVDVWVIVVANAALWMTFQFSWAIFEWLYKKIPGVD